MALEALSSNELLNFIIYDTISTAQYMSCNDNSSETHFLFDNSLMKTHQEQQQQQQKQNLVVVDTCCSNSSSSSMKQRCLINSVGPTENPIQRQNLAAAAVQGRKKRRRRQRVCKNKEEAETQRMTHIAVERNRRKQMNEHLAVLRSLMPESYVQRGDQASIVGGAIEFVKELEHHLQSLEAHKFTLLQQGNEEAANDKFVPPITSTPFAQFFSYPQYTCSSQFSNKYTSKSKAAVADIEVTLIETHANLRILSRRRLRQVSKMVTGLQTLYLTILHLNVTTLDPLVLYSISAKVEEGCVLNSADDIAAAVHHILRIIEEEATLCGQDSSPGLPRTC